MYYIYQADQIFHSAFWQYGKNFYQLLCVFSSFSSPKFQIGWNIRLKISDSKRKQTNKQIGMRCIFLICIFCRKKVGILSFFHRGNSRDFCYWHWEKVSQILGSTASYTIKWNMTLCVAFRKGPGTAFQPHWMHHWHLYPYK